MRNIIKNETKNANKNNLVCSIFAIFLIFWTLELKKLPWWLPVFKPDFQIFPYNEQLRVKKYQHSNFSSKAVNKIIAEAEAKETLFASAVPQQFFCQHNQTNLCICLNNSLGSLWKLLWQCVLLNESRVNKSRN